MATGVQAAFKRIASTLTSGVRNVRRASGLPNISCQEAESRQVSRQEYGLMLHARLAKGIATARAAVLATMRPQSIQPLRILPEEYRGLRVDVSEDFIQDYFTPTPGANSQPLRVVPSVYGKLRVDVSEDSIQDYFTPTPGAIAQPLRVIPSVYGKLRVDVSEDSFQDYSTPIPDAIAQPLHVVPSLYGKLRVDVASESALQNCGTPSPQEPPAMRQQAAATLPNYMKDTKSWKAACVARLEAGIARRAVQQRQAWLQCVRESARGAFKAPL